MSSQNSDLDRLEKKKKEDEEKRQLALESMKTILNISEKYSQFSTRKLQERLSSHLNGTKTMLEMLETNALFKGTLRPYQMEGVLWLLVLYENGLNGILADEMGLGKTIQIITLLCYLMENVNTDEHHLIVLPLSTLPNWEAEFRRFAPQIQFVSFHGVATERQELARKVLKDKYRLGNRMVRPVILTNYEMLKRESNFFRKLKYNYVIIDEGHRLKNHLSQTYASIIQLNTKNKILLTGTPLQNDLKELWSLLHYLFPRIFKDCESFSCLIMNYELQDNVKLLETEKETKVISKIHKIIEPFMLRRMKKDVLTDMVPKKEILVYCSLTKMQKELYREIISKACERNDENKIVILPKRRGIPVVNYSEENIRVSVFTARKRKLQEMNEIEDANPDRHFKSERLKDFFKKQKSTEVSRPKYKTLYKASTHNLMAMKECVDHPYLLKYPIDYSISDDAMLIDENLVKKSGKMIVLDALLTKLKEKSHKVLIFSTFVIMLNLLEEYMILRDYNYSRLDGTYSLEERELAINKFNNDEKVFIFLISTRAGGLGLNLASADTVIFFDRDWNPQVDLQAQDRCHRIGQTRPVMVYTLVAKNTIDEKIIEISERKRKLEKLVITSNGKSKSIKKEIDLTVLKQMLEEVESIKINCNGLLYTDNELNKLLDRSDLYAMMGEHD